MASMMNGASSSILLWTLSGRGRYPASATLEISAPQPMTATGGFTYSCR